MPITELVALSKSGAESSLVIQRIRDSRTTYALRGSDFSKLKAIGVPDPVLDYLQQSFVDNLDLYTRYWVTGAGLGGCSFCYPQPVDVDTLESGYGEVPATPPGQYLPDKPQGTPAWVPYPPKVPSAEQISVSDIERMAKNGVSDAQIIERINHSRDAGDRRRWDVCHPHAAGRRLERFRVGRAIRRERGLPRARRVAGSVLGSVH